MRLATPPSLAVVCLVGAACTGTISGGEGDEGEQRDLEPPVLEIEAPARGAMSDTPEMTVLGTASDTGSGIDSVVVNGVEAELHPDGTFSVQVLLGSGIDLLETVVTDRAGNKATDVRAALVGTLVPQGTPVRDAVVAEINSITLRQLSRTVATTIKGVNFGDVIAAFNPVFSYSKGSDVAIIGCFKVSAKVFVNAVDKGNVSVVAEPSSRGLNVVVDVLDIAADADVDYRLVCQDLSRNFKVYADRFRVTATLDLAVESDGQLSLVVNNAAGEWTGFDLVSGNIPSQIMGLIEGPVKNRIASTILDNIEARLPAMADRFLADFSNKHWAVPFEGASIDVALRPSAVQKNSSAIRMTLEAVSEISGTEGASYLSTPHSAPTAVALDAGRGVNLAVADDVANQLLAGYWAGGFIDRAVTPEVNRQVGAVLGEGADFVRFDMLLPPVLSAEGEEGPAQLSFGDIVISVSNSSTGETLLHCALSATLPLEIDSSGDDLSLVTAKPVIRAQLIEKGPSVVLNIDDSTIAAIAEIAFESLNDNIDRFLGRMPVPSFGVVTLTQPEVESRAGYLHLGASIVD